MLTFYLLLLPYRESVIVLCFVVCYFMSILVLQSSWWGRESWLLCLICLPGVSWWLSGSSSRCHGVVCSLLLWYFLIYSLTIFDLDPESICIERIHRIGRRQQPGRTLANQTTQNIHRPLIALFRDYQDVELILSNAGKLRGKQFCINLDYPQEIINARKPLLALKRDLKKPGPQLQNLDTISSLAH